MDKSLHCFASIDNLIYRLQFRFVLCECSTATNEIAKKAQDGISTLATHKLLHCPYYCCDESYARCIHNVVVGLPADMRACVIQWYCTSDDLILASQTVKNAQFICVTDIRMPLAKMLSFCIRI